VRHFRTFLNFRSNTIILGAELLGRKRGIFVLAANGIAEEGSAIARDHRGMLMKNFNMITGSYALPAYSVASMPAPVASGWNG
jgi:hypothetical protein